MRRKVQDELFQVPGLAPGANGSLRGGRKDERFKNLPALATLIVVDRHHSNFEDFKVASQLPYSIGIHTNNFINFNR